MPRALDDPVWLTLCAGNALDECLLAAFGYRIRVRKTGEERLFEARPQIEQVSIGDYILSGGELGAMVILDACIRLLPGVMGAASSGDDESFETGLLEYPQYTRPALWEGRAIPQVLRSGDHAAVEVWRKSQAEADTRLRRPDLWERHIGARDRPASGARRETKDE